MTNTTRERSLELEGAPNFRDAGGYRCDDGRLAWGRLFRSGHLADLTLADRERVSALELGLVCDLRRDSERQLEPSRLPDGVDVVGADITPGSHASAIYSDATRIGGAGAMYDFMCDINREFVRSQTANYREVFARLLDSGADRVLFHCSAGKDRTGFAIAVLQMALGVDQADIEADYALSARYFLPGDHLPRVRRKYEVDHLRDEDLLPMLRADLAYLHCALAAMREHYGDSVTYLQDGLGLGSVERRELRRRFIDTA